MSQYLPKKNFRWLKRSEIKNLDISKVSSKNKKGYILEVDLDYPSDLLEEHNRYPLALETLSIPNDKLSPYSQALWFSRFAALQSELKHKYTTTRSQSFFALHNPLKANSHMNIHTLLPH